MVPKTAMQHTPPHCLALFCVQVGAGISLAPNGLRVLDSLRITPNLAHKVCYEVGEPMPITHIMRPDGSTITKFDSMGEQVGTNRTCTGPYTGHSAGICRLCATHVADRHTPAAAPGSKGAPMHLLPAHSTSTPRARVLAPYGWVLM